MRYKSATGRNKLTIGRKQQVQITGRCAGLQCLEWRHPPPARSRLQHAHGLGWSDTERLWDIYGPVSISLRPYNQSNWIAFWRGNFTILSVFMQNRGCSASHWPVPTSLGNQPHGWDLLGQNWRWWGGRLCFSPPGRGWEDQPAGSLPWLGAAWEAQSAAISWPGAALGPKRPAELCFLFPALLLPLSLTLFFCLL